MAALALALPYIGPLAALFGFVPLPPTLLGSVLLIVVGYIAATEFVKNRFYAKPSRRRRMPTHARRHGSGPEAQRQPRGVARRRKALVA